MGKDAFVGGAYEPEESFQLFQACRLYLCLYRLHSDPRCRRECRRLAYSNLSNCQAGAAQGPAAEEHGAFVLHAVGLGRNVRARPPRALRRLFFLRKKILEQGKKRRVRRLRTSRAPSRSCIAAEWTTTFNSRPSVSTRICRLRPVTFLAASKPCGSSVEPPFEPLPGAGLGDGGRGLLPPVPGISEARRRLR